LSRAERHAQHRERLLLATAQVLQEGDATVARIIERAGVGRSTFYEFFDSPEHVISLLEQRARRSFEQALDAAFAAAHTPLERLRAIVRAWLEELDAHPSDARVALEQRVPSEPFSPPGKLLLHALERTALTARESGVSWLGATDDLRLLAATAAVEALSRRHLAGHPLRDGARVLTELVVKILR
jgi:AcrR family transcriptional regulator